MDSTKENVIGNTTEGKVDWTKRIDDNGKTEINNEQQKVINELEEVLSFLKGVKILNDEALVNIKKPLVDLQSSLKYLPIESSFDALPKEIKTSGLLVRPFEHEEHVQKSFKLGTISYLCDSESFKAASVCREWKEIVKRRFTHGHILQNDVKIGKHCSNYHECEDNSCFMPGEMLKASMTHKLNIPLTICHPLTEVDSRVVTEGLLSVSNLTITSECDCKDDEHFEVDTILSDDQVIDYFDGLDKRVDAMEKLELIQVDMAVVDQDKLINCLLNKTKWLTLDKGQYGLGPMFCNETFIKKLSQISTQSNLKYLILRNFEYAPYGEDKDLSVEMADGLCQVENVKLQSNFPLETETLERLIENILTKPIKMKSLLIMQRTNFRKLMSPGELLTMMGKMELLVLRGFFTRQQLQAARILPHVKINGTPPSCVTLKKGRNEIF